MTESLNSPEMHPMSELQVRTPEQLLQMQLAEQARQAEVQGGVSFVSIQEGGNQ